MEKKKSTKERNSEYFWSKVEPRCVKCGYNEFTFNLDSHHIQQNAKWNKNDSLSKWLGQSRCDMLQNIIDTKFTILCKHCHNEIHWKLKHKIEIPVFEPINVEIFRKDYYEAAKLKHDQQKIKNEKERKRKLRNEYLAKKKEARLLLDEYVRKQEEKEFQKLQAEESSLRAEALFWESERIKMKKLAEEGIAPYRGAQNNYFVYDDDPVTNVF